MKDKDEIICHCQEVSYGTILEAIENGADDIDAIGDKTDAGITCGACIEDLEEILEEQNNK